MTPLELIEARIELNTVLRDAYEMFSKEWTRYDDKIFELEFIKRALK